MKILRFCLLTAFLASGIVASAQAPSVKIVTNPILPVGPDPWVEFRDGFYYYMNTTVTNLTLWKARSMAEIGSAPKKIVWTPPATGPYSHDIWAPEIHFLEGKWYIYFAADAGDNQTHRIFVLENSNSDPFQGQWEMKGRISDAIHGQSKGNVHLFLRRSIHGKRLETWIPRCCPEILHTSTSTKAPKSSGTRTKSFLHIRPARAGQITTRSEC